MKKSFIYILMAVMSMALSACSKFDANSEGIIISDPDPTPQDTIKWDTVTGNDLIVNPDNMMATAYLKYVKNGIKDSIWTESWKLDIKAEDMTVYRDAYQPTIVKGRTPDAQRSVDQEFKDKYGNMQTRHHYTQDFEFNNFTHSISGAWNTAYVLVKGKPEYFWPYDGLYFDLNKLEGVGDTIHIVRNDSILAVEDLDAEYEATLRVDKQSYSRYVYYIKANIKVYSFIGLVEKKEEIPTADDYIPNLEWHAKQANRFWNGSMWCDAILFSSSDKYYMLVTTFKLNHDGTKEEPQETKMYSIAKSKMSTPSSDEPYNAVMWDKTKNQPIPCHLTVDGSGWNLGARYADGTAVTKRHDRNEAVISGVKNLSEKDNATPSPWIATSWTETQYNGVNYYAVTWKTTTHTLGRTIADASLK